MRTHKIADFVTKLPPVVYQRSIDIKSPNQLFMPYVVLSWSRRPSIFTKIGFREFLTRMRIHFQSIATYVSLVLGRNIMIGKPLEAHGAKMYTELLSAIAANRPEDIKGLCTPAFYSSILKSLEHTKPPKLSTRISSEEGRASSWNYMSYFKLLGFNKKYPRIRHYVGVTQGPYAVVQATIEFRSRMIYTPLKDANMRLDQCSSKFRKSESLEETYSALIEPKDRARLETQAPKDVREYFVFEKCLNRDSDWVFAGKVFESNEYFMEDTVQYLQHKDQ